MNQSISVASFKNSQSLTLALNLIPKHDPLLKLRTANMIAKTISTMHTDYGSKLLLIQAAINHPTFRPYPGLSGYLLRPLAKLKQRLTSTFKLSQESYTTWQSESQKILIDAKNEIMKSRNKLILC
tara:strand:+ start:108 stop:485 length:378 start_codon:yes stop_codon:yes gene_type:complete